jgi:hypothetical protein
MSDDLYLPDLDDGDFRRLIDARRVVVIKFWSAMHGETSADHGAFARSAAKHPEVAFAQSNVDLHHGLALRTHAADTPSIQGWVDGNLVHSQSGELNEDEIETLIREIKTHKAT